MDQSRSNGDELARLEQRLKQRNMECEILQGQVRDVTMELDRVVALLSARAPVDQTHAARSSNPPLARTTGVTPEHTAPVSTTADHHSASGSPAASHEELLQAQHAVAEYQTRLQAMESQVHLSPWCYCRLLVECVCLKAAVSLAIGRSSSCEHSWDKLTVGARTTREQLLTLVL